MMIMMMRKLTCARRSVGLEPSETTARAAPDTQAVRNKTYQRNMKFGPILLSLRYILLDLIVTNGKCVGFNGNYNGVSTGNVLGSIDGMVSESIEHHKILLE